MCLLAAEASYITDNKEHLQCHYMLLVGVIKYLFITGAVSEY